MSEAGQAGNGRCGHRDPQSDPPSPLLSSAAPPLPPHPPQPNIQVLSQPHPLPRLSHSRLTHLRPDGFTCFSLVSSSPTIPPTGMFSPGPSVFEEVLLSLGSKSVLSSVSCDPIASNWTGSSFLLLVQISSVPLARFIRLHRTPATHPHGLLRGHYLCPCISSLLG